MNFTRLPFSKRSGHLHFCIMLLCVVYEYSHKEYSKWREQMLVDDACSYHALLQSVSSPSKSSMSIMPCSVLSTEYLYLVPNPLHTSLWHPFPFQVFPIHPFIDWHSQGDAVLYIIIIIIIIIIFPHCWLLMMLYVIMFCTAAGFLFDVEYWI